MAILSHIDGPTRRLYIDPLAAVSGTITLHPVEDLYREYRGIRRTVESVRRHAPMLVAAGNVAKGGGKYTPRYAMLLDGAKLMIPAWVAKIIVTGEILTDDQTDPFDTSMVAGACLIIYQPAEAEVIKVTASGNEYSLAEIAAEVIAGLNATTIPVDLKKINAVTVTGAGVADNKWRPA